VAPALRERAPAKQKKGCLPQSQAFFRMIITCRKPYSPAKNPRVILSTPFCRRYSGRQPEASGSVNKLQVKVFAQYPFHRVGDRAVHPAFQPN
jgi:hypothetical protein